MIRVLKKDNYKRNYYQIKINLAVLKKKESKLKLIIKYNEIILVIE